MRRTALIVGGFGLVIRGVWNVQTGLSKEGKMNGAQNSLLISSRAEEWRRVKTSQFYIFPTPLLLRQIQKTNHEIHRLAVIQTHQITKSRNHRV
jgi:hypothetical protein